MDALESQALSNAQPAAGEGLAPLPGINPDAPGDTVAVTADGNPVNPDRTTRDGKPVKDITKPVDSPEVAEMQKALQRDYTQKMQALAEQQRMMQQERLAYQQMQNQLLQNLATQNQPKPKEPSVKDFLPEGEWERLEPTAKQALTALERTLAARIEAAGQKAPTPQEAERIAHLERQLAETRFEVQRSQWAQQAAEAIQKYGQKELDAHAPQIWDYLTRTGGTVEQAVLAVAPQVIQSYWHRKGMEEGQRAQQTQWASSMYGGGQQGPSGALAAEYRPGESMRESAAATLVGSGRSDAQTQQMIASLMRG